MAAVNERAAATFIPGMVQVTATEAGTAKKIGYLS